MIGTFSRTLARIPHLATLLGESVHLCSRFLPAPQLEAVAGWGRKETTRHARRVAAKSGLPFISLEDGFLRSVELGKHSPPLSIVVDDVGIYYDATGPSRLEHLIAAPLDEAQQARCVAVAAAWRAQRVSKYNHLREYADALPERFVLVVDQTLGDASIIYGQAGADSFQLMLEAALRENPNCTILVKIHPDVFSGLKQGHFDPAVLATTPGVEVLAEDVHPAGLLERAEAVYVVTSQMGFEGLLWNKRVRTFGMPFYAGWGLTEDTLARPARRHAVALENLIHGALIAYPRYLDPETGQRCEVERVLEWMGLQRRMRQRFPRQAYAIGFSGWKKPIVQAFFQGTDVTFATEAEQVPGDALVIVWGMQPAPVGCTCIRLEDGFLRSVGLGVDLTRPLSWIQDSRGLYYNATCPSDLEHLLLETEFEPALLARAAALRQRIVATGITKYNVGGEAWRRPEGDRHVILVPGQVETDASLAYGAPGLRRNIDLLKAVRAENPQAYIVYKPHPDVVAGLRQQGSEESAAQDWCDEVLLDCPIGLVFEQVDAVHVLTSLAGFEALLRGKAVTTYGQPFYAGWGLTRDHCPPSRRTRILTLDELVSGALILYPGYVSRVSGKFTTPERVLDELLVWRDHTPAGPAWFRELKRLVLRRVVGVR